MPTNVRCAGAGTPQHSEAPFGWWSTCHRRRDKAVRSALPSHAHLQARRLAPPCTPTNCLCYALHFGCATFEGAASCGLPCTLNLRAAQAAFTRGRHVRAPAKTKLAPAKTKLARWRVWRHAAVAVCAPFGVRLAPRARALCCAYACVMALAVRFVVAENA